jgi:bacterioferritin-associated ferredoxin
MFVCVCHGYNESCVREALKAGPSSLGDLYRKLGERPRCGKCVPEMRRIYQDRCAESMDFPATGASTAL